VLDGPAYLHGTIGSMVKLRGFEPTLVSGFGVIVGLDGTGSPDVPASIRGRIINMMKQGGFASPRLGTGQLTPERILASNTAAVVVVEGMIPPGAVKGTRFDLLVSAIPGSQTTSVENGQLYTIDLGVNGASFDDTYTHAMAKAYGPIYVDPFAAQAAPGQRLELQRQGVILSGGTVITPRTVELMLNRPSWSRSRVIADRINERFPRDPGDKSDIANAQSDQVIQINIPARFGSKPDELLRLIGHIFVERTPNFEPTCAQQMANLLAIDERKQLDVTLVWRTLGKTALPTIRQYYRSDQPQLKMASLEAGVHLSDDEATAPLLEMATQFQGAKPGEAAQSRAKAAQLLSFLPRNLRANKALKGLLDDPDNSVRIAAYEALFDVGDPLIQRTVFGEAESNSVKFVLDLVPSVKPLIYITQEHVPRIVIFNPDLGLKSPTVAQLWNNKLMIRTAAPIIPENPQNKQEAEPIPQPMEVFFQDVGDIAGKTQKVVPTVANLVYLLGHRPSQDNDTPGFDLPYSRIVGALTQLCRSGDIVADGHPCEVEVHRNSLAEAVALSRLETGTKIRAESNNPTTQPAVRPDK
jgi:hypothetical protein